MRYKATGSSAALSCLGLSTLMLAFSGMAHADADPCNFNDGSEAFSYEQVMACYESVPFDADELANTVAFMSAARERSDLREVLQARYQWREELAALAEQSFDNDHDFQLALVDNHKKFFNPHWRYQRPYCYTFFLAAFIPFDFGSTVVTVPGRRAPEQIIFIESAPYLGDLYAASTGIDPEAYVGSRVVSINGVPVLDYFRAYGTGVYRYDENAGQGLNEVLQNAAYSIRVSVTHDVPPDRPSDIFVLETRTGQRQEVEIPWVFAPRGAFGLGQIPLQFSSSTADFQSVCQEPSAVSGFADAVVAGDMPEDAGMLGGALLQATEDFTREIAEKREMVTRLEQENRGVRASYFEVAPGQKAQQLSIVVPKSDGAVAYQLSDRATVIRLDDFVGDWKDEVIAATTHACEHSDRLVFDMRNNNGGFIENISWLASHLLPERGPLRDRSLRGRFLNSDPGRNELAARMETWSTDPTRIGFTEGCWWGYEAGCWLDLVSEQPLTDPEWYTRANFELRGGVLESLTPEVLFRSFRPEYDQSNPIACPGKFTGPNLVIFSNGTGVSAGYFWPALMRPEATIVTAGGFVDEPVVFGVARGGAVWGMNNFEAWIEQYLEFFFGPATQPLPFLVRNVDSFIEQPGSYVRGSASDLYINDPAIGDVHIEVWSDTPETDGYVYGRVLRAVQSVKSKPKRK